MILTTYFSLLLPYTLSSLPPILVFLRPFPVYNYFHSHSMLWEKLEWVGDVFNDYDGFHNSHDDIFYVCLKMLMVKL